MRRQYRYFAIADYKPSGNTYDVLRQDGEHEELFVATEGWLPSHASERRGFGQWEIDERRAHLIIDDNRFNRFMPLDRPFRYFALTDDEHPVDQPRAVVRRWHDGPDEHEDVLVSASEWAPSTPPAQDTVVAVPIDAAAVDRFAAILEERENGYPYYHYVAIVDEEHGAGDPRAVVRERPATGEFEVFTENLRWEPGTAAGRRVPINVTTMWERIDAIATRVHKANPHRHYVVVTDEHPDVTDPAALVRQHICRSCLPSDEVYRANGQWVRTNAVIPIRAGVRPGKVVPITAAAADVLRETWRPRRVLEREPVSQPLFRYYAVVSDAHLVDDPLTVVRVLGDTEESYTPALRWEQTKTDGERVQISAVGALRFEETQFRRVFGEAEFRYYAVVNALHPDPEDPAAVFRKVTDDLDVWVKEVHGPGHQWTYVREFDDRVLIPVAAEKAAQLREICDSRPAAPLWYHRGTVGNPQEQTKLVRFRNELGLLHREYLWDGVWKPAGASVGISRLSGSEAHFDHPLDIEAVRSIEADGNYLPPSRPEPEHQYSYHALIDEYGTKPAPVKGLIRTWEVRKSDREEEFSGYSRGWSSSWVREDVGRGKEDYEIIGISEAEALRVQETLVQRADREREVRETQVYYAITDAEHGLHEPVALIRAWPDRGLEMVEEYVRDTGYGKWEQRRDRPAGDAVELTESNRHRAEKRAYRRFRST